MKKLLCSLSLLALLPATLIQAADPVKDSHGFGTYVVKNLPMYERDGHKPNIDNGVRNYIDLYVVSYGDYICFKQVVCGEHAFDASNIWNNQLWIWRVGATDEDKDIPCFVRSADNRVAYSEPMNNGLSDYGDDAIQLSAYAKIFYSPESCSDLFDYKRGYINTPTGDQVVPTFEAALSYNEDNTQATVTFSNPSEEVFWFIENGSSKSIQFQDAYTFSVADAQSVIVYAVDFDGNMSLPYQVFPQVQITDQADNAATIAANTGKQVDVALTRSLSPDYWNTICLPFDMTAEQVQTYFGAGTRIVSLADARLADNGELSLVFTDVQTITAGTPYLIQPSQQVVNSLISQVVLSSAQHPVTIAGIVEFVGLTDAVTLHANDNSVIFLGADNYLYFPSETAAIRPLRAYFHLLTASQQKVRSARIAFRNEVTTDMEEHTMADTPQKVLVNGQIYIIYRGNTYNTQGQIVNL